MKFLEEFSKKRAIKRIKSELAFLGFDVSRYSDRQIEEATWIFAESLQEVGVTTNEVTDAFTKMVKEIRADR